MECVVCDKSFKSEKQLEAHERSKKHTKAVQQLRWQMRKEGVELQLNESPPQGEGYYEAVPLRDSNHSPTSANSDEQAPPSPVSGRVDTDVNDKPIQSSHHSSEDDDYAPVETIMNRVVNDHSSDINVTTEPDGRSIDNLSTTASSMSIGVEGGPRKVGKAKAKRERKAAAAQTGMISNVRILSYLTSCATFNVSLYSISALCAPRDLILARNFSHMFVPKGMQPLLLSKRPRPGKGRRNRS